MTTASTLKHTHLFFKFSECFIGVIAIINLLMNVLEFLPPSFWEKYGAFFDYQIIATVGIAVIFGAIYSWIWHRRESEGSVNSGKRHMWILGIIRYWLAFSISTYGFAKIFKTQLQTPSYRLDMPLGDINGFGLTWYYFGYSYTLAVIIALFQIGGSILLLYRRTTLLGVMILLPVMVNIIFINMFYSIAAGAFYNSVIFTMGLTLLLLTDVQKLKTAFWDLVDKLPPFTAGNTWLKHGLRLLPIAAACALINYYVYTGQNEEVLKGTWKVEKMIRNGKALSENAWLTDTTAWKRVYFAGWNGCAFSPNPYRYKPAESLRGSYQFDSLKNSVKIDLTNAAPSINGTLHATVTDRTRKAMRLHAIVGKDTVVMHLARLR